MVEISVVIPTYNRLPILGDCIAALEEQTLNRARYELIVVDDGSTDGTPAALAAHSGLAVICQLRNRGPAAARNAGIHAASGTYVLFLDDDIIARPQLLEQHLTIHAQERGEGAHPGRTGLHTGGRGSPGHRRDDARARATITRRLAGELIV